MMQEKVKNNYCFILLRKKKSWFTHEYRRQIQVDLEHFLQNPFYPCEKRKKKKKKNLHRKNCK